VVVSDSLPTNPGLSWSIDGGTGAGDCAISTGVLTCNFGDIAAWNQTGLTVHITSPTTPGSCGTVTNVATGSATNSKTAPIQRSASVMVQCPTLTLSNVADSKMAAAGGPIGYGLTVKNAGSGTARAVTLNDPLPAGPDVSWSIDGGTGAGSCLISSGTLTCSFGDMAKMTAFTVHVSSSTSSASVGKYVNVATASATNSPGSVQAKATIKVV
jgi:uncharacterized repeat protein (TIGR01451 family)